MITRRNFALAGTAGLLSACTRPVAKPAAPPPHPPVKSAAPAVPFLPMPDFYGAITDEPYPVPAVPPGVVPPHL